MNLPTRDLAADLDALGVALPDELVNARANAADLRTLALDTGPADDVVALLQDSAMRHDAAQIADAYTVAASRRDAARHLVEHAERAVKVTARHAWTSHADRLIGAVCAAVAPSVARVTDAAKHLELNDDAEAVVARGGKAAEAWRKRADLDHDGNLIRVAAHAVTALAAHADVPIAPHQWPLALAPLPDDASVTDARDIAEGTAPARGIERPGKLGNLPGQAATRLAVAGTTLDIAASLEQLTERLATVDAARAAAASKATPARTPSAFTAA